LRVVLPCGDEVWHRTDSGGWYLSKYGSQTFNESMTKKETFESRW